jgi:hypothetical protein
LLLNCDINAELANPKIKERFAQLGSTPMPMTPGEIGKLISVEAEKWKVIRAAQPA